MKIIYCFVLALCCLACTRQNDGKGSLPVIELGDIRAHAVQEKLALEEMGARVQAICLETNDSCLLNNITQLEDVDYFWIVADRQVYQFDKNGRFLRRIGQKGQGPEEYIAPEHILVDGQRRLVYVLDYLGRKVMTFDYDGRFTDSWALPEDYSLNRMALCEGKLCYTSFANSVAPDLLAYDHETGGLDTLSFRDRTMGQEAYAGQTFVYRLRQKTYLYHYFNDTVYNVSRGKLVPAYLFRLGDSQFSYRQLTLIGDYTSEEAIDRPKVQLTNFVDTEKYLFVAYTVVNSWQPAPKPDSRFAVYSKESGEMHPDMLLASKDEPLFGLEAGNPVFASSDERSLYTVKQADKLTPVSDGLEEESNPVIVKYTFD